MSNAAPFLVLLFLTLTFIQSGSEKIFQWQPTINWLQDHFKVTYLKNYIPILLMILVVLELLSGILTAVGCIEIIINGGRTYGFYGCISSCICLLCMLFGQRVAQDYDGARTIVLYFIPAVMGVFWLG